MGTGELNHGHADDNPNTLGGSPCDASTEYVDSDCSNSGNEPDLIEKRTHTLPNGEVIRDIGGNIWEWVKYDHNTDYTLPPYNLASGYISQLTDPTVKGLFGPAGDYTRLNSGNFGGLGFIWYNTAGAAIRGGYWLNGAPAGVFDLHLAFVPSWTNTNIGFRCVYQ